MVPWLGLVTLHEELHMRLILSSLRRMRLTMHLLPLLLLLLLAADTPHASDLDERIAHLEGRVDRDFMTLVSACMDIMSTSRPTTRRFMTTIRAFRPTIMNSKAILRRFGAFVRSGQLLLKDRTRHISSSSRWKKRQLLRRIGRFERLADPTPVYFDRCFASCNDAEMTARRLLRHFTSIYHVSSLDVSVEKLLLDFFVHSLTARQRKVAKTEEDEEAWRLILAAREWMERSWSGADDYHGEATLREMEEGENGWVKQQAATEQVAVDLEGLLFGLLMQELVVDLATC
ncbi:uncharacterized protein LOC141830570 [Curcuma longa]|uniref:uncharacterized protein LOC141830570 n=1 Tax=Curcuma longa TaxID=136217 RepID=UPI003D9F9D19